MILLGSSPEWNRQCRPQKEETLTIDEPKQGRLANATLRCPPAWEAPLSQEFEKEQGCQRSAGLGIGFQPQASIKQFTGDSTPPHTTLLHCAETHFLLAWSAQIKCALS